MYKFATQDNYPFVLADMDASVDGLLRDEQIPLPARTLLARYVEIEESVESLLHVAQGDPHRLRLQQTAIATYEASFEKVSAKTPLNSCVF